MLTYTYKEYETPFCGGIAHITLYVEVYPRDEWGDPMRHVSIAQLISEGIDSVQIRDIVTHEDHYCPFDLVVKAFPNLDLNNCSFSGGSGIIAKAGHPFDQQQYYEWKKQENLIPPEGSVFKPVTSA